MASGRPPILALAVLLAACSSGERPVAFHAEGQPQRLSEWHLVEARSGNLALNDRVLPYDLSTSLFSDYAHKLRTVWMPAGEMAEQRDEAAWSAHGDLDFPVGTIFSKTFYYPLAAGTGHDTGRVARIGQASLELDAAGLPLAAVRLLETRLLVRRQAGWSALPYVWNAEQTDAFLEVAGEEVELELLDDAGRVEPLLYIVPDVNQCAACHATNHTDKRLLPIGPKVRLLNREHRYPGGTRNQLRHWSSVGYLPELDPSSAARGAVASDPASGDLEQRARAYLDVNCGHCHNPEGPADTSALFLDPATTETRRLGYCKPPVAAGRGSGDRLVSIHPGRPEASILVYRMSSNDPGIAMPELGRSTVHSEGVELISDWIAGLDGDCRPALAATSPAARAL